MLEAVSEELKISICQSLNTNLKQVQQDVETLRQWIKNQPHLPQCSSDTMLTAFLIACKNRMERVKEKIDNYYTARSEIKDFYADRDPKDKRLQECAKEIRLFALPKLTPDGCRLSMASFVTGDPKKYDIIGFSKRAMAGEDIIMNQEAFTRGRYFVFDGTHFSMGHVLRLTPRLARQLIHCAQDVLPVIIKAIIFINAPTYLELAISIIKPFMKSKLFKKIHIHTEGPEVLERYFPKSMLPKEYGGEEDSMDNLNEAWMKCLEEKRDWFLTEGSFTIDETKRVQTKQTSNKKDIQDLQGSFKTLCVD